MNLNLNGKTALVTGSTRGIGFGIAKTLRREGAEVCINGLNRGKINKLCLEHQGLVGFPADTTKLDEAQSLIDWVIQTKGSLDILVCNVGSGQSVPAGTETLDELGRMMDINFLSATNVIYSAMPHLKQSKGTILCISSICGTQALGCPIGYSVAKSSLDSFVRNVSRPLGKHGVRINCISPGNILFEGSTWEKKLNENRDKIQKMIQNEVSMQRFGTIDDVANLSVYLCSPLASFITGSVFFVDGGQLR